MIEYVHAMGNSVGNLQDVHQTDLHDYVAEKVIKLLSTNVH